MSALLSRMSAAQFLCLAAALIFGLAVYALRPLPNLGNADAETIVRDLIARDVQSADLTEAVTALQTSGFIKTKAEEEELDNTFAASAIFPDGESATGLSPVPSVIAIVQSRGVWEAYFRQENGLIISAAGDQVGDWYVDHVSQGEIVLSNGDITEIIDIFGAEEETSQE